MRYGSAQYLDIVHVPLAAEDDEGDIVELCRADGEVGRRILSNEERGCSREGTRQGDIRRVKRTGDILAERNVPRDDVVISCGTIDRRDHHRGSEGIPRARGLEGHGARAAHRHAQARKHGREDPDARVHLTLRGRAGGGRVGRHR